MGKTVVPTALLMQPIAQFSFGMRAGDVVRIGATAGTDAARRLAGATAGLADIAAQTEQMLENFAISIKLLGAGISDVVHIRSYLNDWRDLAAFEAALLRGWPECRACHSLIGSAGFPLPQATVESELIAIVGGAPKVLGSDRLAAPPALGASAGVRNGKRHFCAVGPVDVGAMSVAADPLAQARGVLRNLEIALETAGLRLSDVVMLNVNVCDLRHLPAFEAAFRPRLTSPLPARTVCATSLAHPDWLFSIESIAIEGGGTPVESGATGATTDGYSCAMLAGDELFIGGQFDVSGASVAEQAHGAWSRIEALLAAVGMSTDDVVHTTNVLTDWRSYGSFNAAYGAHVKSPYPPRATVVASLPDASARVMIEAHAHRSGRNGAFIGYAPPSA
jgi:2-iminobutanoate/2-iminopropanoate deaminase